MTVSVKSIPVVDIHADNLTEYWPVLRLAIHSSTFIAIDLEMSGIGNRKDTMTRSTEDRYKAFCEIAKTRSVLSLGISVFQRKITSHDKESSQMEGEILKENANYAVHTFNVMVLRRDCFVVEPGSLKFLLEHGFDFNRHYSKGITYNRTDAKEQPENSGYTIQNLFFEILRAAKPVVVHNGILDLVFLYQNFYADLPKSSLSFLADLSEMFPGGIFDTKFIAEYHTHSSATFLNYIFKKSWRMNLKDETDIKPCVAIECHPYPASADVIDNSIVNRSSQGKGLTVPCEQYAAHGHCPKGMKCEMSHDLDVILDHEECKKEKKRKRKKRRKEKSNSVTRLKSGANGSEPAGPENSVHGAEAEDSYMAVPDEMDETLLPSSRRATMETTCSNTASGNHRAGFDAFMTGFCMATFLQRFATPQASSLAESLPDFVNKLNLSGKDVPLTIAKSQYCKTSTNHKETWTKVMSSS